MEREFAVVDILASMERVRLESDNVVSQRNLLPVRRLQDSHSFESLL